MRTDKRGPLVSIAEVVGVVLNPEPWLVGEALAVRLSCGHTVYLNTSFSVGTHVRCLPCKDEEALCMGR